MAEESLPLLTRMDEMIAQIWYWPCIEVFVVDTTVLQSTSRCAGKVRNRLINLSLLFAEIFLPT